MLEIAKSNSKISNNSIRLAATTLIINIARLAAIALAIPVIATPLKFTTLIVPTIATPLKRSACKAASWKGNNN
jgi:hypothetical protein